MEHLQFLLIIIKKFTNMIIDNLHQPFVYKHNDKIKILVSEILTEKLYFKFGNDDVIEDYWKIKVLDENYNLTTVQTPNKFEINYISYDVIAECNGFVQNNKFSYVVGLHNKQDNCPLFTYLVEGDFDHDTNIVSNTKIIGPNRTGFKKDGKVFTIDIKNCLLTLENGTTVFLKNYLDSITRIIGVDNKNEILITGNKGLNLESYLYSIDTDSLKKIKNTSGEDVYKCSYLEDNSNITFAYAKKTDISRFNSEYKLHIENSFILE